MSEPVPRIRRDGAEETPQTRFQHVDEIWRDYQIARWQFQELVQFRLDPDFPSDAKARADWMGDERELEDALGVHRQTLFAELADFENLPPEQLQQLPPEQRLSLKRMQIELEREAELQQLASRHFDAPQRER